MIYPSRRKSNSLLSNNGLREVPELRKINRSYLNLYSSIFIVL